MAIKMGKALPYDFKLLLPMLAIMGIVLGAACKYGGAAGSSDGAPAMKMGG